VAALAFADKGIRSLETARECAHFGACKRTIAWITGLPPTFILRNLFDGEHPAPRGRPPYTEDFVFRGAVRVQAEAGAFANKYRTLRLAGFLPAPSLIAAFRHYLSVVPGSSISFDEAFYLVCNLDAIWACAARTLQLTECADCGGHYLLASGSLVATNCPFCKDVRDHGRFGPSPTTASSCGRHRRGRISDRFRAQIAALSFRHDLHALGAHARVIDALMSTLTSKSEDLEPACLVRVGKPLLVHRWKSTVKTVRRVQFSLAAAAYRRLLAAGFLPEEAVVASYRYVSTLFRAHAPLSFDRCFEVLCLFDAQWGVPTRQLELLTCPRCGAEHLVSHSDSAGPQCPFCLVVRLPTVFFPHGLRPRPSASPPDASGFSGGPPRPTDRTMGARLSDHAHEPAFTSSPAMALAEHS
jgi:hypothetical protein